MRASFLAMFLLFGGDGFTDGARAYREGRFQDAFAAFAQAERDAGFAASAELLHNRALAALRVGRLHDAEYSAEKAIARGGAGFVPFRDFLLGSTEFVRCQRAEAETTLTDPDPTAFDRAITHAAQARDAWFDAAARRHGWAEAERNAERAQRKLDELIQKRDEAERDRQTKTAPAPQDQPEPQQPDPDRPPDQVEQLPVAQQAADALTDAQLAELLARLDRKEAEKRKLRRAQQQAPAMRVEKDW